MLHRNYHYDAGDDDDQSDGDDDDDHDDSQLCILCAAHSLDFVPIAKMDIIFPHFRIFHWRKQQQY